MFPGKQRTWQHRVERANVGTSTRCSGSEHVGYECPRFSGRSGQLCGKYTILCDFFCLFVLFTRLCKVCINHRTNAYMKTVGTTTKVKKKSVTDQRKLAKYITLA